MPEQVIERTRWTSADLDLLPENGLRYEIIDGELFMTKMPHWEHQRTCGKIFRALDEWSQKTNLGQASLNPGVIFSETDDVVPDVVWISHERLEALLDEAGHLTGAPELAIEVLSPGVMNERRDRQAKLKLYEMQGVREYWIVNWRLREVEVFRRDGARLLLVGKLLTEDTLTSPLLPGFACLVTDLFG
ncbi:MAG: Uma2 family endonuclease [Anaerolineales bacterium]